MRIACVPPHGRVVATMLSRLSVAPVMSKVLRSVDLATRFAIILLQGIPAFRDFTIRDPPYFVIQFQAFNS